MSCVDVKRSEAAAAAAAATAALLRLQAERVCRPPKASRSWRVDKAHAQRERWHLFIFTGNSGWGWGRGEETPQGSSDFFCLFVCLFVKRANQNS